MMLKSFIRLMLVIIVLIEYGIFVTFTNYPPALNKIPDSSYLYLTEGFLSGHLDLSIPPSKGLLQLSDPYDPKLNLAYRIGRQGGFHDMSLYKDKLYLYFGPLPVLSFFIPAKWVTGSFLSESCGVYFFLSAGFVVLFCLLIKIKDLYFKRLPEFQLLFSGLVLAFATNAPYLLARPRFYEVAVASAFCYMSVALYFLFQSLHRSLKLLDVFLFSSSLSLVVAGRPHFVIVCVVLLISVSIYVYRKALSNKYILLGALFFPPLCVGVSLAVYNYLRFDSIFEFGANYQLLHYINARQTSITSMPNVFLNIIHGLYYYFFRPWWDSIQFITDKVYMVDLVRGVLFTTPVIFYLAFLPGLARDFFKNKLSSFEYLMRFLLFMVIVPLTIVLFLLCLSSASQRYETDFIPYLVMLSIISAWLWHDKALMRDCEGLGIPRPYDLLLRHYWHVYFLLGAFSICVSIMIGNQTRWSM